MRNLIRNDHAKFGEASSIRTGRSAGVTKSRKNQKESERRYIFWLQNAHFQTVIKS